MYTYKLPITQNDIINLSAASTPVSTNAVSQQKSDLLKQLSDLDAKFKNDPLLFDITMPENLGLTKMEYDALTDEQITELAKSQMDAKLADEKVKLENELNKLTTDLTGKKESVSKQSEEIAKAIEQAYEERRKEAENDALKRGLARSSIITGKIEEFDKNKLSDKIKLESDTTNALSNIDLQISSLEAEKNLALENFNITLAAELISKINELKKDREAKEKEVLKYNNEVAEKEAKYQKEKELSLFDIEKSRKSDVSNARLNDYLYSEKAKLVKEFYDKLPPEEALRQIGEDASLKEHLGNYYNYIVQYFKNKS